MEILLEHFAFTRVAETPLRNKTPADILNSKGSDEVASM